MNSHIKYSLIAKSLLTSSDSTPSFVQKGTSVGYSGTIILTNLEKKQLFDKPKKNE